MDDWHRLLLLYCLLGLILGSDILRATEPSVTFTTQSQTWATEPPIEGTSPAASGKEVTISIDPNQTFQTMDGFGGCFNELGWAALQTLTPDASRRVLKDLFDPSGANFNYCRMPIGASDYALSWYSLDETPGDYGLEHFSVARDELFLIPYIHAAMQFQPSLRIWGSPWSPPTWLKTSGTYNGGSLKTDTQSLSAYAAYFSRYVQEYHKRGVNVVVILVQNEPFAHPTYPSCAWEASDFVNFIGNYLEPQFAKDKPGAEIWLGTLNTDSLPFFSQILDDKAAGPFIAGAGFQYDGKKLIGPAHEKYPNLPLMQTESECGNGSDNWGDAAHTWSLIHHYISNGVGSYMYWNMVLDETGSSTWGWKQNALITVNRAQHKVRYNPEFYVMKHFSAFVRLGAKRIGTGGSPDALAFANPDGAIIVEMANFSGAAESVKLNLAGKIYGFSMPNTSIATVQVPSEN
jgi:glucosylceramidase